MRAGLYLRFSDADLQTERSLQDQERVCRELAEKQGWTVVAVYSDAGISGASMLTRPGIQQLMADAETGKLDVVVSEALDRISRRLADTALIFDELNFFGVGLHTLSEGAVTQTAVIFKGGMNSEFLVELGRKVRRGAKGRALAGKNPGGIAYGYEVVRRFDGNGKLVRGERQINSVESPIVIRIFDEYRRGKSPRAIARDLNIEGIPGPGGRPWSASTINGSKKRGLGVINNSTYVGRVEYGRLTYIKNPRTGKRVSRASPEGPVSIDALELQIVSPELWAAVKARQDAIAHQPTLNYKKRPPRLLSYLIRCGACGSGCSTISATHVGCSASRNRGTCDNRLTFHREKLENLVLGALSAKLMNERRCALFCEEYVEHSNRLRLKKDADRQRREAELVKTNREIANLIQALKAGADLQIIKDELNSLELQRLGLERELGSMEAAPVLIHPKMAEYYHSMVQRVIEALNEPAKREEAAQLIRHLIAGVRLTPNEDRSALVVDLEGDAAGILCIANDQSPVTNVYELSKLSQAHQSEIEQVKAVAGPARWKRVPAPRGGQAALVAGVGFEPTTFGL